jgi:hypothetical protein
MHALFRLGVGALLQLCASAAFAQFDVPTGGTVQLAGGTLDLQGDDLQVAGTLSLGSGAVSNATGIDIPAGGVVDAGSGTLTLSGDWSNLGNFVPGSSTVYFIDGAAAQSTLSGSTTFNAASFVSASGKNYLFPVGLTQTFDSSLTILGSASTGIQFRSATPGQTAFVDLLPAGTQDIDFVGVSDVHATGQHLAPTKTNDGGTGNALGWFGNASSGGSSGNAAAVQPAPTLAPSGLLLLVLVILFVATRRRVPLPESMP